MDLIDKITQLNSIRSDIRSALVAHDIEASEHNFINFASDINDIGTYKLPSAYQEVEYLTATGSQYIETGLYLSSEDIIICDVALTSNTQQGLYCARTSTSTTDQLALFYITTSSCFRFDHSINRQTSSSVTVGSRYKLSQKSCINYINGEFVSYSAPTQFDCIHPLYIGASVVFNNDVPTVSNKAKAKYYDFEVRNYDGSEIKMKLKMCKRVSDSVGGMYDFISKTFLTSSGTEDFVAGPEI